MNTLSLKKVMQISAPESLITPVIIFMLLSVSFGYAGNIEDIIKYSPGKETYPQAAALILLDNQDIRIAKEGQIFRHRATMIKLLDDRGRGIYGDQTITFNSDEDTVYVEVARTIVPDGEVFEPEKEAYTLTSAPEVQWASAYAQLKQLNITFPALDIGAVIHLEYRIEPKQQIKKSSPDEFHAGSIKLFGGYDPILEMNYVLDVADERPIQYELQNSNAEPVIFKDKERKTTLYTWKFKYLEQIIDEPNSVGLGLLVPRLLWTTFKDWEALGMYISKRFWPKVDSSNAAVDGYYAMNSKDLRGKPALMRASMFVTKGIRNVDLPLGLAGYTPNSADQIWKNKYGDPMDKALLLTAILRANGFNPLPVLVTKSRNEFSRLPVLEEFTHVILAVPMDQDTLWIDPTADNYLPGSLPFSDTFGSGCMLMDGAPLLLKVPLGEIESRTVRTEMDLKISAEGDLEGTVTSRTQGDYGATARSSFKNQKQQELKINEQKCAARIAHGTEVTKFVYTDPNDLTVPFLVSMNFTATGYSERQQDLLLFDLPENPFTFTEAGLEFGLKEIRYPVQLPPQGRMSTELRISIPDNFDVSYLPQLLVIDNPYLYIEVRPEVKGTMINWLQVIEIKADNIPITEYQTVRSAYERLELKKNRIVIFEKNSKPTKQGKTKE